MYLRIKTAADRASAAVWREVAGKEYQRRAARMSRGSRTGEGEARPVAGPATERKVQLGFAAALALLLAVVAVGYVSVRRLTEHGADVRRADQLIDSLHAVRAGITDAETAQRGYIITGQAIYLTAYQQAELELPRLLQGLRRKLEREEMLGFNLREIERLVLLRLERARETIEIRRTQGFAAAQARLVDGIGKKMIEDIRALIADAERQADAKLDANEARANDSATIAVGLAIGGGGLATLVVIAALWAVRRDFAGSRKAEAALRQAQAELEARVIERTSALGRANAALEASEGRLRLFIEHAPAALAMFDEQMRYLTASRRWRDDYGLGEREIFGVSHYAVFPEISEAWKEVHRRALAGEVVRADPDKFIRADGSTRWLRWEVRPWMDARGAIRGIVIFTEDVTLNHEIAAANERLAAIVESSNDAIIGQDLAGVVDAWNHGATRLTGYTAEEMLGQPVARLFPAEGQEAAVADIERLNRGGTVEDCESERVRKDGSRLTVAVTISAVRDAADRVVGYSSVLRDVSARKLAETALRESEARIHAIVENLTEGLLVVDQTGRLLHCNAAARRMLGLGEAVELRDLTAAELGASFEVCTVAGERLPRERWPMRRILAGERLQDFEVQVRRLDWPELRVFSYSGSAVKGVGENVLGYVAITDVTERRRAEDALRSSEMKFARAFANNPAAIAMTRLDDGIVYEVNDTWEELTGYRREEMIGRSARAIWPSPEEAERFVRELREHGALHGWEQEFRKKSGERFTVQLSTQRLTIGGEELILSTLVDITQRKQAEEAREMERRRVVLLAEASRRLVATEAPRAILRNVLDAVAAELAIDVYANYIVLPDGVSLHLENVHGLGEDQLPAFKNLRLDETLCGLTVAQEEALILPDLVSSKEPRAAGVIAAGLKSYVGHALRAGPRVIGTLSFATRVRREFSKDDLELMSAVADQISSAMERARLLGELRKSEQRYRMLHDTMVQGVVFYDEAGAIVAMNPAARQMLGIEVEELAAAAEAFEQGARREDGSPLPAGEQPGPRALREAREVRDEVIGCINRREGRPRWLNVNAVPQFGEGRARPTGVFAIIEDITERRRAEAALRESEERFATAFRASPTAMVLTSRVDRRVIDANETFLTLAGVSRAELIGGDSGLLPLVRTEDFLALRQELLVRGSLANRELELRTGTGELRQVLVSSQLIELGGEPGTLTTLVDITARKQAEQRLRFQEALLSDMGRIAHVGGWSLDAVTGQGYWTEEVIRIHDLPPDTPGTKELGLSFYAPSSRPKIAAAVEAALATGQPYDLELEFVSATGARKWVRTIGHPYQEDGRVVQLRGSIQDITERKHAERRLATQAAVGRVLMETATLEAAARNIVEAICVGEDWELGEFWLLDAELGRLRAVATWAAPGSGAAEFSAETAGMTFGPGEGLPGEIWRTRGVRLVPELAADPVFRRQAAAARAGLHSGLGFPILIGGEVVGVLDFLATAVRTHDARLEAMFEMIGRQIGLFLQRRQAEDEVRRVNAGLEQRVRQRTAELEAANKELEAFSYSVSHDLRAPLRAVDGFSRIVIEDFSAQLPPEGRRYLENVAIGARQMGTLIDDLLTFSRLSRLPLERSEIDTGRLVAGVLQDLQDEQAGRALELRCGELPRCRGDQALLRQVWVNLLANAFKYTRRRTPALVEIGVRLEGGLTVFFVRDNGAGFDMRYAAKLFGVFQRLHRSDEYEGTGVGLAIVQRIVHRHGGRVWAEAAVEQGATFSFTLGEEISS